MPASTSARSERRLMSIGQVLSQLRADFPDISISKIRFLETEGLVEPQRTASGYRKFAAEDLERLRYVLSAQRDHYLPLKVIKEHLDAIGRGLEPPEGPGGSPRPPSEPEAPVDIEAADLMTPRSADLRLSAAELLADSGLTQQQLEELVTFGLLRPVSGSDYFDADALSVARTVAQLATYGLEPRHLRVFKTAADREAGLVEQVLTPLARQRDGRADEHTAAVRGELSALAARLHVALVRIGLHGPP